MNKRKWLISHVTAAALFSCGIAFAQAASVMDTIGKNPNLTIATQLINEAGLSPALSGESLLTIFVPNDAAFQALPAAKLNELKSDKELLKSVLIYHVVPSFITVKGLASGAKKTLNGNSIELSWAGKTLTIENAAATQIDIEASNGMVNVIDAVMIPPKAKTK